MSCRANAASGQTQTMRFRRFVVVGFLACVAGLGCSGTPDVVSGRQIVPAAAPSFTSQKQGFSVHLPATPVESAQDAPLPDGQTLHNFLFTADSPSGTYILISTPTPPSVNASHLNAELEAMQEGFVKSSKTTVQKSEDIQLGGFQGRELSLVSTQNGAEMRVRFYVTPKFFYQFMAVATKENAQSQAASITQTLDSFRILPQ